MGSITYVPYFYKVNSWKKNQKIYFFKFVKCFFFPFLTQISKTQDSSSVGLSIIRQLMQINWLKLKNWIQESDSCTPLFCIKIARTWRHSDIICGSLWKIRIFYLHLGCTIDGPKDAASFALKAPLTGHISRKSRKGLKKHPQWGAG